MGVKDRRPLEFGLLNQYKNLFLVDIQENDENKVTFLLKTGQVSETTEALVINDVTLNDVRPIIEDNNLSIKVLFPSYVAYNVRNETYTTLNDYDLFEGNIVREYNRSRYLEYIMADTIATDNWPGKLRHFGICCGWHVIDVISVDEPEVILTFSS